MTTHSGPTRPAPDVAGDIRAAIGRAQVRQSDLADRTGIHPSKLSRRLSGHSAFTITELTSIASALDLTFAELVPSLEADE